MIQVLRSFQQVRMDKIRSALLERTETDFVM